MSSPTPPTTSTDPVEAVTSASVSDASSTGYPTLDLLMQVSDRCPLDCVYCYRGEKSRARMSEKTMARALTLASERQPGGPVSAIWLGAEPLTAGLAFFVRARKLQKMLGVEAFDNRMQTSGVLLTPEMADFFAAEGFRLSFSLDGPPSLHNRTRPYAAGRSSFDDTMRAVRLVQERGQRTGAVCVITRQSLPLLEEIYAFFKSVGLGFRANAMEACGSALGADVDLALSEGERTEALCRLFDLWYLDPSPTKPEVRPLSLMMNSLRTGVPQVCHLMASCQSCIIAIGADGTAYPCARFDGSDHTFGNIHDINSIAEFAAHPLRQALLGRHEQQDECDGCSYRHLCNAGCPHVALLSGNLMGVTSHCASNKAVFRHIETRIARKRGRIAVEDL